MMYTNKCERYGDPVEVTVKDYQELNPDGDFVDTGDAIREYLSDEPGDFEIIAE